MVDKNKAQGVGLAAVALGVLAAGGGWAGLGYQRNRDRVAGYTDGLTSAMAGRRFEPTPPPFPVQWWALIALGAVVALIGVVVLIVAYVHTDAS